VRPCNRIEKKVCIKERKNLSLIQRRKRESERIHSEIDKEDIFNYQNHYKLHCVTNSRP